MILVGLAGLCVSMFCFGLSTTFWGLVLRCVIFVLGYGRAHEGTAAVGAFSLHGGDLESETRYPLRLQYLMQVLWTHLVTEIHG